MDAVIAWIKKYWLDVLNFGVACGNAELMQQILIAAGRHESTLLTIAVFCSELILATAGIWGKRGILIAMVMFATSIWGIRHIFPETWIIESYFSVTIFAGTLTSIMRHGQLPTLAEVKAKIPKTKYDWSWLWSWAFAKPKTNPVPSQPPPSAPTTPTSPQPKLSPSGRPITVTWPQSIDILKKMSRADLSRALGINYDRARQLLEKWGKGEVIDWQWVIERID